MEKLREYGKYALKKCDKIFTNFPLYDILFHEFFTDSEKLEFSPFDLQYIILDNDNDPDDNFFNIRLFSDMSYFTVE